MMKNMFFLAILFALCAAIINPFPAHAANPDPTRFYEPPMPIFVKHSWGFWNVGQLLVNETTGKTPEGAEAVQVAELIQDGNEKVPLMVNRMTGELNWIGESDVLIEYLPLGYKLSPALIAKITGQPAIAAPVQLQATNPTVTSTAADLNSSVRIADEILDESGTPVDKKINPFPMWLLTLLLAALALTLLGTLWSIRIRRQALVTNPRHPVYQGPSCRRGLRRYIPFLPISTATALQQADNQLSEVNQVRRAHNLETINGERAQLVKVSATSRGEAMIPVEYGDGRVLDARLMGERLRLVVYRRFDDRTRQFAEIVAITFTVDACDNGCVWTQSAPDVARRAANELVFRNPGEVWRSNLFTTEFNFTEIENFLRRQHAEIVAPVETQPATSLPAPALPTPAEVPAVNEDQELLGFLLTALVQGQVELNSNYFARIARAAAEQGFRFEVVTAAGNGTVVIRGLRAEAPTEEKTNVTTIVRTSMI